MNIYHYPMQPLIYLFPRPRQSHRILCHLQTRCRYSSCIRCLTRRKQNPFSINTLPLLASTAYSTLTYTYTTITYQLLRILPIQLILRCTWQCYITFYTPRCLTFIILTSILFAYSDIRPRLTFFNSSHTPTSHYLFPTDHI
jgi:hypothetical protein